MLANQPRATTRERTALPPLAEYLPQRSPQLTSPRHLAPLLAELDRAIEPHTGQRFFWFSVPPRHWKTYTLRHGAAKHLEAWPREWVAWFSHTQQFANKQSRAVRRILASAGVKLSEEVNRQDEWELASDGGMRAKGAGSAVAGEGFRLIVVDDPFGRRQDAESQVTRDRVFDWLEDDVITRLAPDGCLFLVHTRWHVDDAIGRYRKRGWPGVNIKALADYADGESDPLGRGIGEALLPNIRPREWLEELRANNARKFVSLYQGEPREAGAEVFKPNPPRFVELPEREPFTVGYGADLAYTAKTSADRSVVLRLQRYGDRFFVTGCREARVDAPSFCLSMSVFVREKRGPVRWYIGGGGEKGAAQFLALKVPELKAIPATVDKLVRATPASEAWNGDRIILPAEDSPFYGDWVDLLIDEATEFTGVNDQHDDFVDALAAGFDVLSVRRGTGKPTEEEVPAFSL